MGFADDDSDYKVTGYQDGKSKSAILRRQVRELEAKLEKKNTECREREKAAYKTAWKDLLEDEFEDVLAEAAADAYLTSCYGERRGKNGVE